MKMQDRIAYGVCYTEVIHKILTELGISPAEANDFVQGVNQKELRSHFKGSEEQWSILVKASKDSILFSEAMNNFAVLGDK